jgi:hypothetical protein
MQKKNCAFRWFYLQYYTRIHGQQNIKLKILSIYPSKCLMVTTTYKTLSITIKTPILFHSVPLYMFGITVTVNNYCLARQVSLMEDIFISVAYEQSLYMLFRSIYVLSV